MSKQHFYIYLNIYRYIYTYICIHIYYSDWRMLPYVSITLLLNRYPLPSTPTILKHNFWHFLLRPSGCTNGTFGCHIFQLFPIQRTLRPKWTRTKASSKHHSTRRSKALATFQECNCDQSVVAKLLQASMYTNTEMVAQFETLQLMLNCTPKVWK